MNNLPLIEFNPKLVKLSKQESQVLKLLVEAARLIAPIYLKQENESYFSKDELEKYAKNNPSILSPFTVVEKLNGRLVAIPYHKKYVQLLQPIAEKLNQAAKLTENKEFSNALKKQAKALLDGTYEQAMITWLKMKPYILDISIGPVNHYDDQLFFGKASYQAWVGVVNKERTNRLNNYKEIILNARRKVLMSTEHIANLDNIQAKIDDVILFSGHMARTKFVGVNFPMDLEIVKKYGSAITLFLQTNDHRMQNQIIPAFNKIFSKAFRDGFSTEDLTRGNLAYITLHELSHSYLYYKNAKNNLKDLYNCIFELAATVLGLRMAGHLLLKDAITNKELESMIVAYMCRSFALMNNKKGNESLVNYAQAGTLFVNFMLEGGALKQKEGMAIPNFMKIFVSLNELSNILERLLSSGTRKDAEVFIKNY